MLSSTNARLAAARRLTRRKDRRETGRFLAEGAQAVREALAAGVVVELFATGDAMARHPELTAEASEIAAKDAAELSETRTPQGLVAVVALEQPSVGDVVARGPRLIVLVDEPNDPGNLGTLIRTADAAGADAVLVSGGVDPYNGKAVRASAGSLFHLPVVDAPAIEAIGAARAAGLQVLATTGAGADDLDALIEQGVLAAPTLWLIGTEAHGLPESLIAAADRTVRVPIHGRAESLNLAVAAGICLYASARAQRR